MAEARSVTPEDLAANTARAVDEEGARMRAEWRAAREAHIARRMRYGGRWGVLVIHIAAGAGGG